MLLRHVERAPCCCFGPPLTLCRTPSLDHAAVVYADAVWFYQNIQAKPDDGALHAECPTTIICQIIMPVLTCCAGNVPRKVHRQHLEVMSNSQTGLAPQLHKAAGIEPVHASGRSCIISQRCIASLTVVADMSVMYSASHCFCMQAHPPHQFGSTAFSRCSGSGTQPRTMACYLREQTALGAMHNAGTHCTCCKTQAC